MFASVIHHCTHRLFFTPGGCSVYVVHCTHTAPTVPTGHSQDPICSAFLAYTPLTQPPPSHRYPETTDVYILFVYYSHKGLSVCICIQNPLSWLQI